jgi:hypothetical protein
VVELSPNALRLLARVHRIQILIPFKKLALESRGSFTEQPVAEIVTELEQLGYLRRKDDTNWMRTRKAYTDEMRRELARLAQVLRRERVIQPNDQINIVRKDVEPWEARLFGYPTEPVFLTGRVHRLKD